MHLFVIHSYIHLLLYSAEQQQRLFFIWKVVWKTDMNFSLHLFKYIVTERIWVCVLTFTYVFHNKERVRERDRQSGREKVSVWVEWVSSILMLTTIVASLPARKPSILKASPTTYHQLVLCSLLLSPTAFSCWALRALAEILLGKIMLLLLYNAL